MFYIKENLNDTTSISVEINNENVYCRCPQCGAEVPVDLSVFWTAVLNEKNAGRKRLPLIDHWYTSVLPIPTAASMTISKTPDDTAALR